MKRKILIGIAFAIVITAILVSSLLLHTQDYSYAAYVKSLSTGNEGVGPMIPSTYIPGFALAGDYLYIGFNYAGSFGVGNASSYAGFQYPIGLAGESLAIAYWGEGYTFAYETNETGTWVDHTAWFEPNNGWPLPTAYHVNYVSFSVIRNDADYAKIQSVIRTYHGAPTGPYDLKVTFTCLFPKHGKYVILKTTIQNLVPVKDPIYKRFVDWDVHGDTINNWTSDSNSAYADWTNATSKVTYEFTVSAQTDPSGNKFIPYVDLYGWDDYGLRRPYNTLQSHNTPLWFDGAAEITFDLGAGAAIMPKAIGDVFLYYEASET